MREHYFMFGRRVCSGSRRLVPRGRLYWYSWVSESEGARIAAARDAADFLVSLSVGGYSSAEYRVSAGRRILVSVRVGV